jgi:lipopolysaccharide export system protein LptA
MTARPLPPQVDDRPGRSSYLSRRRRVATLAALATFAVASPAFAERADRDKPINLEADRISVDDIKKVQVYEGSVVLTQGTLQIRTDRLVVTQDADGFQRGSAIGGAKGLARFRQKREAHDDYIEGEGERIDYDARSERTEFFVRAWVKNGQDEVRGNYIVYDSLSEKYVVTSGSTATGALVKTPGVPAGRVRAVLQPKSRESEAAPAGDPLPLKGATSIQPRGE